MADKLFYLTVQDVLWINRQIIRRDTTFQFAKLEEATYYQYAYGDSHELLAQAARFIKGFMKMAPLGEGNEATAFVATMAFLSINGHTTTLRGEEAADWFRNLQDPRPALESVARSNSHGEHHEVKPNVREHISNVLVRYAPAIGKLSAVTA
ncbi:hypothetical protein EON81_13160 [bacterium]|nr:MAG: hypothetical protein EON81_13160 [bacterium]